MTAERYIEGIEARAARDLAHVERVVIDLGDPMATARCFTRMHPTLRYSAGAFFDWHDWRYVPVSDDLLRAMAYRHLESSAPKKPDVLNFVDALKAVALVVGEPPCWLDGNADPDNLLVLRNGLLNLRTRELRPSTPDYFTLNALDVDYADKAPAPRAWLNFLNQLWPDDSGAIACLQEYIGLAALTDDTSLQKALMLIGPKRGGKGTILRVAAALAGASNVCSPTLASLGTHFGLQGLIGKRLALLSDARLSSRSDIALVAESLLRITGEDHVSAPRKHLGDWHGRLRTRFILASNELPSLVDASTALCSRFIVLQLAESFHGREDHSLEARLLAELPGILVWAMDGLDRLRARGRLLQPASGQELVDELERLASPVQCFIDDLCIVGPEHRVGVKELHEAWCTWCRDAGHGHTDIEATFSKKLRSALPRLKVSQPRMPNGERHRVFVGLRPRRPSDATEDGTRGTRVTPLQTYAREKERSGPARVPRVPNEAADVFDVDDAEDPSDPSDRSDPDSGFSATKKVSHKGNAENWVTSVTSVTGEAAGAVDFTGGSTALAPALAVDDAEVQL